MSEKKTRKRRTPEERIKGALAVIDALNYGRFQDDVSDPTKLEDSDILDARKKFDVVKDACEVIKARFRSTVEVGNVEAEAKPDVSKIKAGDDGKEKVL